LHKKAVLFNSILCRKGNNENTAPLPSIVKSCSEQDTIKAISLLWKKVYNIGSYGRYQVFMTYMYLSLFFIPCFKWNKQYYVQSTCCNTVYSLDPEIGRRIARGENIEILPQHLTQVQAGYRSFSRRCTSCGFETQEDFEFCPKCGQRF